LYPVPVLLRHCTTTYVVIFTRHSCTGRYCWGAY